MFRKSISDAPLRLAERLHPSPDVWMNISFGRLSFPGKPIFGAPYLPPPLSQAHDSQTSCSVVFYSNPPGLPSALRPATNSNPFLLEPVELMLAFSFDKHPVYSPPVNSSRRRLINFSPLRLCAEHFLGFFPGELGDGLYSVNTCRGRRVLFVLEVSCFVCFSCRYCPQVLSVAPLSCPFRRRLWHLVPRT